MLFLQSAIQTDDAQQFFFFTIGEKVIVKHLN